MKRDFADLHLHLNLKDSATASRIINKAATIGYSLIAVPFLPETREDEKVKLQSICTEAKIDLASRVDMKPRTHKDLMYQLRRLRRRFEVVCVTCENKEVARQAAKDRRVDLLNFPSLDFRRRFFDSAEAELASKSLVALEIDIRPLLILEGPARVRLLSSLHREAAIAREFHVPIVVSSGVANATLLRRPRELAALASLFGLDEAQALETVSRNPASIVRRNRQKLSPNFVAPGIRVIKGGKDC
jgi:ribonuclease P/MRP protein subunit RPP1